MILDEFKEIFEMYSIECQKPNNESDFDNKIIDFCINKFCQETGHKEEEIRQDKQTCKRLKIKCENAKKLLSIMNETVINIDNFYGQEDMMIPLNRNTFEDICKDLYEQIEKILLSTIKNNGKTISQIDEVILVGGATRMTGIKNFLSSFRSNENKKYIKSR